MILSGGISILEYLARLGIAVQLECGKMLTYFSSLFWSGASNVECGVISS